MKLKRKWTKLSRCTRSKSRREKRLRPEKLNALRKRRKERLSASESSRREHRIAKPSSIRFALREHLSRPRSRTAQTRSLRRRGTMLSFRSCTKRDRDSLPTMTHASRPSNKEIAINSFTS